MTLSAVRVCIAGADFYLLPEADEATSARLLAGRLVRLRGLTGGTLRLLPRTAPPTAGWTRSDPAAALTKGEHAPLSDREDPGSSWRDVLGSDIGDVEVVELHDPVALWHWAVEVADGDGAGGRRVG